MMGKPRKKPHRPIENLDAYVSAIMERMAALTEDSRPTDLIRIRFSIARLKEELKQRQLAKRWKHPREARAYLERIWYEPHAPGVPKKEWVARPQAKLYAKLQKRYWREAFPETYEKQKKGQNQRHYTKHKEAIKARQASPEVRDRRNELRRARYALRKAEQALAPPNLLGAA